MVNNFINDFRRRVPALHQRLMLGCLLGLSVLLVLPKPQQTQPSGMGVLPLMLGMGLQYAPQNFELLPLDQALSWVNQQLQTEPVEDPFVKVYQISRGDSLSRIFARYNLSYQTVQQVMASDESLLALDVLHPGNRLTLQLDDVGELQSMELYIHAGKKVVYQRVAADEFAYQEIVDEGVWQSDILVGEVYGSFYVSAQRAGLSDADIYNINQLFKERLNFSRDIQAGAQFQVLRSENFVGEESTGQSRIEGIRILNRRQTLSAFMHEDGQYYDANGDSLERAFSRYPLQKQQRISSHFNPRRLHPITQRVSPHNGTDFPLPVGSPVLAPADGVVTRIENHPYAGKYIEIQHFGNYKTRYLHLSRFNVQRGQRVTRGQRIALSGNTGRSTGPHLHYELHINNRPVNPMTAHIPLAKPVSAESRASFAKRVKQLTAQMEQQSLLAKNSASSTLADSAE
ncbi:peptidoglycan DD-metalloendopeptidase family protein [Alishewanella sp. 16-MA]|uniref:Peptidoglycan DD-metalloendopeptidase family protein n=1 Tax=Alishewanella maricola TaxID=2795740 RepID=A0ABS8C2E1_9ALTE|nr:peptidoglycan DD-metalloendopeptidase family protein [Alishewanella maricola]MCB5226305.1 peptidoglycan DD-metalloendopeptidase family protein [Alishewanella maricola]